MSQHRCPGRGLGSRGRFAALCSVVSTAVALSCGHSNQASFSPTSGITLDNVCERMPASFCTQDAPCCAKAGYGFDRTFCEDSYYASCSDGVAAVNAGHATFHPEKIDECVRAVQSLYDKCILTSADRRTLQSVNGPCLQIFAGTVPPGGACTFSPECGGQSAYCDVTSGTCATFGMGAPAGQPCSDGCAFGLVCDETASVPTCVEAPPSPIVSRDGCSSGEPPDGGVDPRVAAACGGLVDAACSTLVGCKALVGQAVITASVCQQIRAQSLASCETSRAASIASATDADVSACASGLETAPCTDVCGRVPVTPTGCSSIGFGPETQPITCAP